MVVFDLDGTLADLGHRLQYVKGPGKKDWDAFHEACDRDAPITKTIGLAQLHWDAGYRVEVWSGRMSTVEDKTMRWLAEHGIKYHYLRMRPRGDYTPDDEMKERWLRMLAPSARPIYVFDDRKRVVDMWRRNGILCFHVADGDY